ncbi:MAG: tetratricopeptide repeat protein [Gammaproteobacteria bacterium]|nr:tetratricopeptide repeat protein [Gammaproteobacteria bacterium]
MSLLLDALKKAEKEKQKVREAETAEAEHNSAATEAEPLELQAATENPPLQQTPEPAKAETVTDELELLLNDPTEVLETQAPAQQEAPRAEAKKAPLKLEKNAATYSTVSDDALQLLIYKTNKRYRRKQKIMWGSLLSVAVIILLVTGGYHYYGVLEEVESLERRHKLAMRVVQAEPVKQSRKPSPVEPVKTAEVAQPPRREVEAKPQAAIKPVAKPAIRAVTPQVKVEVVENGFSVRQTRTEDPINALLKQAWLAYNRADYSRAGKAYESVLQREAKNRDALLGMAAVAIKNDDLKKARQSYQLLLKLDPRDQVANAAMANLDKATMGSQEESRFKSLLQQQPSAFHLNYALGNYYAGQGRWPEAQAAYFKAWQGDAENANYAYNLAVSLDQLGKRKEALRFYRQCLVLAKKQAISFSGTDVQTRIDSLAAK